MDYLDRDGLKFSFEDYGAGVPLIFSHGLGGNLTQMRELIGPMEGARVILYDNRGHGRTTGALNPTKLNFDAMADDMAAVLDHLGVESAVAGGVSMGAGISIAFWRRHRDRARALILSRPAWLNQPYPPNLMLLGDIAKLFDELGPEAALPRVEKLEAFASMRKHFPETASALMQNLENARDASVATTFRMILASVPFGDFSNFAGIRVPALVLANHDDPIHPFELAERLAAGIPGSTFKEFPSKHQSLTEHQEGFRLRVAEFLKTLTKK
ncbi:MAG: alpha/beta hydrolase [Acidobacteria bacterium]|nr:alpha/beta hydrolase [Acidobacteriota bacterium]